MTSARDVARAKKKKNEAGEAEGREKDKIIREKVYWRRGETLNEGKNRRERDEDKKGEGKDKIPAGEMERYQLYQPEAHPGPLALLSRSTGGANGVQTQLKLILENNGLGVGSLDLARH